MLLETIFGTKTKIRIITALASADEPKTRNQIVQECGGSVQGIYEQIEELIGAGIIKEENNKVSLDKDFPFYDDITNLILVTKSYLTDMKSVLSRIDEILSDGYYMGGFWGARQKIIPIDYETKSLRINILALNKKIKKRLIALSSISELNFILKNIEKMPKDVICAELFGAEIWVASIERGIIESLQFEDCSAYGAYLVMIQNLIDRTVEKEKLMEISKEYGLHEKILAALQAINKIAGRNIVPLTPDEEKIAKRPSKTEMKAIKDAINTVIG